MRIGNGRGYKNSLEGRMARHDRDGGRRWNDFEDKGTVTMGKGNEAMVREGSNNRS